MKIFAIDPGNIQSAFVLIDDNLKPIKFGKVENANIIYSELPFGSVDIVVIEMVGHYGSGMPAGAEVFDTCVWIGRFMQACYIKEQPYKLIKRQEVKLNLCGSARAKDGNVIQALIDRFAYGVPNKGKGSKKDPGWFYGFHDDIWQAYALGVTYYDKYIKGCVNEQNR